MAVLGYNPRDWNQRQRVWLALGASAVMALVLFAWFYSLFSEVVLYLLLTVCSVALLAMYLVFKRRIQSTRKQLERLLQEMIDLRAREKVLTAQAQHDGLTGLANRMLLADRFRFAVERAKRSHKPFALLMVDLNEFKSINDNYGHAAGDTVLITMARRLVSSVRASDTVARMGGDEFVVLVESIEDANEITRIGQKLLGTLADPIRLDAGVVVSTGASIGLALYPNDGADMNDLLYVADRAMYECKASGLISLH